MPRGSVTLIICNNYTFKDGGLLTPSKVHLICLHVTVTSPCFYIFNLEKCFGSANILVYFRFLWMVKWNLCLTRFSLSPLLLKPTTCELSHLLNCFLSAVVQLSVRCHPLKPPQLQHCLTRSHFAASHLQLSFPGTITSVSLLSLAHLTQRIHPRCSKYLGKESLSVCSSRRLCDGKHEHQSFPDFLFV